MKKIISLIKATMTDNMNIFKIRNKKDTKKQNKILPIFIFALFFIIIWSYANMMMEPLSKVHMEFVALTLFCLVISVMTLIEGIYKSGSILFNCKDDNLMFSLPIKKSTILFVRILKFYLFELLYNTMFLLPAMIAYIRWANVGPTYWISSIIALLLLPIIPIALSCIIGMFSTYFSSKFKFKNLAQIVLTTIFLLGVMYLSFNLNTLLNSIVENASGINDAITRVYYPVGAYIQMITNFKIIDLLIFIGIHFGAFLITILLLSKIYFKINSNVKQVKTKSNNKEYKIKTKTPMVSLMTKELNKFVSSPVFIINAGFGLVLYIVISIVLAVKTDSLILMGGENISLSLETIKSYIAFGVFILICFTALMTSITSSMISLEGKSFSILKTIPIKPINIILAKVYATLLIIIPCILFGNLILIAKFKFNFTEIMIFTILSFVAPLVSELIGILFNLKYPKMDAENDAEVVKQSISSMLSVFTGMGLSGITAIGLFALNALCIEVDIILLIVMLIYILFAVILLQLLRKTGVKNFNKINV